MFYALLLLLLSLSPNFNFTSIFCIFCVPLFPCMLTRWFQMCVCVYSLYTAAILHVVFFCFSWHRGPLLTLSVYCNCTEYRAHCSVYRRKYISTQMQAAVCVWSLASVCPATGGTSMLVGRLPNTRRGGLIAPLQLVRGGRSVRMVAALDALRAPVCQSHLHHLTVALTC